MGTWLNSRESIEIDVAFRQCTMPENTNCPLDETLRSTEATASCVTPSGLKPQEPWKSACAGPMPTRPASATASAPASRTIRFMCIPRSEWASGDQIRRKARHLLLRGAMSGSSASGDVLGLGLAGGDPGHHRAQLGAHLLDRMVAGGIAELVEALAPLAVLGDPLLGKGPVLDVGEDLLHARTRVGVDDAGAARVVAVLGGVGDRVPHARHAVLVHEVDDELHLVEALEVGHLRLVAGVDQRLV